MDLNFFLALVGFTFVSTVTPGPNNMMLLASGVNYGVRRSIPHLLGVSSGHSFMVFLFGLGLGRIFVIFPSLSLVLKVLAIVYMTWLAWKIANASAPQASGEVRRPITFLQAVAFQWVNPKAMAVAITAVTVYSPPEGGIKGVVLMSAVFFMTSLPSISVWAIAGQNMRSWLTTPKRLRIFNYTMASLLLLSLVVILR